MFEIFLISLLPITFVFSYKAILFFIAHRSEFYNKDERKAQTKWKNFKSGDIYEINVPVGMLFIRIEYFKMRVGDKMFLRYSNINQLDSRKESFASELEKNALRKFESIDKVKSEYPEYFI